MRKLRLMFRWTFVFVLLGMLHVHANAYRQNRQQVTLSMKAVSLKDVLWAIERQTSFVFMYNEEDLDKIGKVDVDVQGDDIRTILNVCLRNTNLTYVLQDEGTFAAGRDGVYKRFADRNGDRWGWEIYHRNP